MRRFWPTGGLWRHRDFLKLWSAETVSQFGSQVGQLALPLVAILVIDASAFEVAALTTVEFLPFILFTLPAGVWVDRLPRRPILIVGDFARAALLVTIPIAYLADALTLGQLFVVGFLVGSFQVFFDVAYQSYLPSLVDRTQIIEGNSKFEITRSAAQVGGPGLGGILAQLLHRPIRHPDRFRQLPGLRLCPSRNPQGGASARGRHRRRQEDEPLVRAQGRPALRARKPESPRSGRMHCDLESLLERCVLDHPRLRHPRARAVARRHRARPVDRGRRISRRRPHRDPYLESLRHRSDDNCRRHALRADDAADRLRPHRKRRGAVPRGGDARVRVHRRRLQHRPGLIPASDLPAEASGADELGDALHRVGNDPDRESPRRHACDAGRPKGDHRRRRRRGHIRRSVDRVLTTAPSPRDARAD